MPITLCLGAAQANAVAVSSPRTGLSVSVDKDTGAYEIVSKEPAWTFGGSLKTALKKSTVSRGKDSLGAYQQIAFEWVQESRAMSGRIRLYDEKGLVLFSDTCAEAAELPPAPFPDFTKLPADLHVFSHSLVEFAVPEFSANQISTPWLLFDDDANSFVISPASHFFEASMFGDARKRVASGMNTKLRNVPAGFTQQTIVAVGKGINKTWDTWGAAIRDLQNAPPRPAYDTDVISKYLGYWTDNGAFYYYNYDTNIGYAGTLEALVKSYRKQKIPLRYLQLDSWWYYKTFTGADGKVGKTKVPSLPEGEWNRYGGLLEYKAHKDLFPDGLAAFQKRIGLPLVTHSRWIDPESPYHQKYQISGLAAIDPKWWDDIAAYMKESGIVTYEQDWCDRIFTYSPEFTSKVGTGEAFLDNMARACKEKGITLQYCMPYACYFMQGCKYDNLTTIRTCTDRFSPKRWNDFLYVSRLAVSMGYWPWADVYMSTERNNLLLSTLSAGPVGIGDPIGQESRADLLKSVRADGVIVKPDAAILPLDRCYIADAQGTNAPLISATHTEHNGLRTAYVFAYMRPKAAAGEIRFSPAELGLSGPVYIYDGFSGVPLEFDAAKTFTAPLKTNGVAFYVVAPVGRKRHRVPGRQLENLSAPANNASPRCVMNPAS